MNEGRFTSVFIARFSCCELQHYSFLSLSYNSSYVGENLSPSLVVARKTPDFNRIIGDFAMLLTFYSVGLLSQTFWFHVAATVYSALVFIRNLFITNQYQDGRNLRNSMQSFGRTKRLFLNNIYE